MKSYQRRRLADLLAQGWVALERGEAGRAQDIFSRVLLLDRRHAEAQQGLTQARAVLDEAQRMSEAQPAEAVPAHGAYEAPPLPPFPLPTESPLPPQPRPAWARAVVAVVWTVGFGLLAAGVASSWENLVGHLERTPRPQSPVAPLATALPRSSHGERVLVDARRLLDVGDVTGALAALEQVAPEEPAYPLARKLRDEAESLSRSRSLRR